MYRPCFRRIIRRLHVWEIHDVAAHTRCGDEAAHLEVFKGSTSGGCLLVGLATEVCTGGVSTIVDTVEVGGHYGPISGEEAVEHVCFVPCQYISQSNM